MPTRRCPRSTRRACWRAPRCAAPSKEADLEELWQEVERYFSDTVVRPDGVLEATLRACEAAAMPAINVSAAHGKLLSILARLVNAKQILEIGTLGGYSTIWLARALAPGGKLVTLESVPRHAEIARANLQYAGLGDTVEVRVGRALETLPFLRGPFDLTFIDADKPNNTQYFEWALKLSRRGGLIVVDNVVREGRVVRGWEGSADAQGVRRLAESLAADSRVSATVIQTVGAKGYDGFAVALVL